MKKVLLILACFLFISSFSFAQDAEMQKAWEEYMTPGKMHEMMAGRVGEWEADITMWMDPSQEPIRSKGTAKTESILGGRYFKTEHTGDFMGAPMTGIEYGGYDNAKEKFVSTWIDNFGTGIMYMEGEYNEADNTVHFTGTSTDPMGNEVKVREVVKFIDEDTTYFEMYMQQGGEEFKTMEITFKRKS